MLSSQWEDSFSNGRTLCKADGPEDAAVGKEVSASTRLQGQELPSDVPERLSRM